MVLPYHTTPVPAAPATLSLSRPNTPRSTADSRLPSPAPASHSSFLSYLPQPNYFNIKDSVATVNMGNYQ